MDLQSPSKTQNPTVRQLASLKIVSRLLGHELHAQATSKTIQLSRDEVIEVQTTLDLFIEEISKRHGGAPTQPATLEPALIPARN